LWWLALGLALLGLAIAFRSPVVLRFSLEVGPGARGEFEATGLVGRVRVSLGWESAWDPDAVLGAAELRLLHVMPIRVVLSAPAVRAVLLPLVKRETGQLIKTPQRMGQPAEQSPVLQSPVLQSPGRESQALEPGAHRPQAWPAGARPESGARFFSLGALRSAAAVGGRRILRYLKVEELDLALRLGLGDAAATALACGYSWAAVGLGVAWLAQRVRLVRPPRAQLTPSFTAEGLDGRMALRARIAQGAVFLALAAAVWEYVAAIRRRVHAA